MSDFLQYALTLLIILGVCGAIIGLIILVIPFVSRYAGAYWVWVDDRLNRREDSKNERS